MNAVPAAHHLAEFSAEEPAQPWPEAISSQVNDAASERNALDEAFADGVTQGRAESLSELEDKLTQERSRFLAQLEAERTQWAADTGMELGGRIESSFAELQERIADTVARILKPFLAAELHRQAMAELRESLAALLTTDQAVTIQITGPSDVLEAVRQRLSGTRAEIVYVSSGDCDVSVVAGQARLETQLKTWLAKLDEAVP